MRDYGINKLIYLSDEIYKNLGIYFYLFYVKSEWFRDNDLTLRVCELEK